MYLQYSISKNNQHTQQFNNIPNPKDSESLTNKFERKIENSMFSSRTHVKILNVY